MTQPLKELCPVCNMRNAIFFAHARDLEYFTTSETFTYLRCNECLVVFLRNPPVDRLHEIYPKNYYSAGSDFNESFLYRVKDTLEKRMFRKLLRSFPGDPISVLDVGGGYGWMLNRVREAEPRARETFVLDFDESLRRKAEEEGHVFFSQRVEEFTSERKFDFILMLNIIEHVADPLRVMRAISKALSPGGAILVKTPNVDTLDRYIFQRHNWGGFHCPRHFVLFNKSNLSRMINQCGMEMAWFSYTQGAAQWTASILGMMAEKRIISCDPEHSVYEHPLWGPVATLTSAFDFMRLPFSKTAQMFCLLKHKYARAGSDLEEKRERTPLA
jgi:2-polyprenyl-3-methyl-5-hydroxy-6-metoxy-1,4-benzoquinol methylase